MAVTDSAEDGDGVTLDDDAATEPGAGADPGNEPSAGAESVEPVETRSFPRVPRLWWIASVLWAVTVVAAVVIAFLPSGYLVDSPGNAIDTAELLTIPDSVKTYDHPGGFQMVTVSETSRPVFGQALAGWLDPDADVFPRDEVTGDIPRDEELRYQLVLMQNAKLSAVYQALSKLGMSATMTGGGVFVDRIVPDSPADGVLTIGDTITEIDGEPITTTGDLTRFLKTTEPGQTVKVTVDRLGVDNAMDLDVTIGAKSDAEPDVPFLGIYMETRPNYQFPFEVGFDTGDIAGPSAGLSLTLSLIDKLSPEPLAGGNKVAVTGTIRSDGSVGPIGGVRQKVLTVENAGVKYFLVPEENAAEARDEAGGDLEIIPVSSLSDALDALADLPDLPAAGTD